MKHYTQDLKIEDPARTTKLLFEIAEHFTNCSNAVKEKFPLWDETSDSRILSFVFLRETTNNSILSSIFLKDHLVKLNWWVENKNFNLEGVSRDKYISDRIYSYGVDLTTNYLTLIFSHLETSLRSITKNIQNSKYPEATEAFWKIREYLIDAAKLNPDYKTLLQIFQNIRNSVHNGGFHAMDNVELSYKDLTIQFKKGEPIFFDVWKAIQIVTIETGNFLLELASSELIIKIPFIIHPFATVNFVEENNARAESNRVKQP